MLSKIDTKVVRINKCFFKMYILKINISAVVTICDYPISFAFYNQLAKSSITGLV